MLNISVHVDIKEQPCGINDILSYLHAYGTGTQVITLVG